MKLRKFNIFIILSVLLSASSISVKGAEPIKYGDFNQWVTRYITESVVIGGKQRKVYAVGPENVIYENKPYNNMGGSPWGTSNVYAKVAGVTKASNAVYPHERKPGNKCAKLCTQMESVKVLGLINMNVMVAGSMFLGEMIEPISSTKNPYAKMNMGMPYKKRPKALVFDYKVDMPVEDIRVKSTGFGSKKIIQGRDAAVVFIFLQRRWEDGEGNIHAMRVGTGGSEFKESTSWIDGFNLPIIYGDCSNKAGYGWLGLRNGDNAYYARNSKGELVPVMEEGWDKPDATPTHVILMMSSGNGEPYVGTEGLNLYIDNVAFEY
ncbi:MAG: PCMD domain-containing protein [Muribaculaceae bacterium]|nr:PCMD domain-containing protein [Muribaculaceae bacterium]